MPMDLFNRQTLERLAQAEGEHCVSFYMPTFRYESDQDQNPIRFKNLLREGSRLLKGDGMQDDLLEEVLAPAQNLLEDTFFWRGMSDGLAAFLAPGSADFYRLPLDFEELAVSGTRFHLKPLFPLLASNNRYYVLALSQNHVRLYQGTHYALSEVEAKEMPANIVEAIAKFEDPEAQLQYHTGNRAGGRQDSVFHGQQTGSDDASHRPKDRLRRFFQEVAGGVHGVLSDESAPLVLAGVEYYLPLYRDANKYNHLIEDQIAAGNPDRVSPKELHAKTWGIVEPLFQESQQEAIDRFRQQMGNGNGLASDDLREIIPAAFYSRVDTLFVSIGQQRWGRYDAEENAVAMHEEQEPGDEDLLNLAAVHVHLNGGTVHALRPENMPVESELAATFRYPADVSAAEV